MRQKKAKFPSSLRDLPRPQPAVVFRVEGRGTRGLGEALAVPSPPNGSTLAASSAKAKLAHLHGVTRQTKAPHLLSQFTTSSPAWVASIHACTRAHTRPRPRRTTLATRHRSTCGLVRACW